MFEPIIKLKNDIKKAETVLTDKEARFVVDMYYTIQEYRKSTNNQIRSIDQPVFYDENGKKRKPEDEELTGYIPEPHENLNWFFTIFETLESDVLKVLDAYTDKHAIGVWLKSITGIGPVIAAGLLAHIDIKKCPTAGHIWSYAGLNPNAKWKKGEKRPWNASLKTLCWKTGESFVKVCNNEKDIYGHLYQQRKEYEKNKNLNGDYTDQALAILAGKKIAKETDAYKWYAGCFSKEDAEVIIEASTAQQKASLMKKLAKDPGNGINMLPPAQINERSKRWAVKIFLSHLHEYWYKKEFGKEPPAPYPIAILGHAHKI